MELLVRGWKRAVARPFSVKLFRHYPADFSFHLRSVNVERFSALNAIVLKGHNR